MTRTLLAALVLATACGTPDQTTTGDVAEWTLEQDLFIGGEDEGPESFADIRGLAVDDWGRMYVLEAQTYQVRVFDSTGAVVRVIGRKGSGPGEFGEPNGLALARNGDIWVYDPNEHRVTVFDSSGQVAKTWLLTINSYGYVLDGGLDTAGFLYDQQGTRTDTGRVRFLRRINFAQGDIDTLPLPPCSAPFTPAWQFGGSYHQVPFTTRLYMDFDPGGAIWCGDTREVRLTRYALGDTIAGIILSATVAPAPVTEEERRVAVEEVKSFMQDVGTADAIVDFDMIPEIKPVLVGVDLDPAGRGWVRAQIAATAYSSSTPLGNRSPPRLCRSTHPDGFQWWFGVSMHM